MVGFQASVIYCSIPRICPLLLFISPCTSWYSNPQHIYHTSLSTHLGVPCLPPIISVCHTRSFAHLSISRLRPSMPNIHPVIHLPSCSDSDSGSGSGSGSSSGSYCMPISPLIILLSLSSRYSVRVSWSSLYVASWRHHAFILPPPPSCPVSLAHTPNKGHGATHNATVHCRLSM